MQLGTRWNVGSPPPPRLPEPVVEAVLAAERGLAPADTSGWRWTLTWLESRPIVELDPAPGSDQEIIVIRTAHDGAVVVTVED